ncbi:hypothetical protein G7046_g434 [Stylonectria norvegica]|nr:hypothetical protein G7046_g434 [Stylonectria norvegica]
MAPIRVGIVGLNSFIVTEGFSNGQWGLQHLNALVASPYYEIVAVCNSTVESSQKAIEVHKLGPAAKAYGSSEDLANDPNVDLVVVSVAVDKHFALAKPVLQAKKNLYIEFPVATTTAQAKELAALAKANGVKAVVGAQAVSDPSYRKMNELVKSKAIGDVVFSTFSGQFPMTTLDGWPAKVAEFLDENSSVSRTRIAAGHALAPFIKVLGDFQSVQGIYKNQDKTVKTLDDSWATVDPAYKVTAPDTILLQGILESGAVASFSIRATSRSTVDDIGYRWLIAGTEGEIEFTSKSGIFQGGAVEPVLRIRKFGEDAKVVEINKDEAYVTGVQPVGVNIARAYEAFAKGEEDGYETLEGAVKVHKLLDQLNEGALRAP